MDSADVRPWTWRGAGETRFGYGLGACFMKKVMHFIRDDSGATAIEYALIASLIAVAIITAVQTVGTKVSTVFSEVGGALK